MTYTDLIQIRKTLKDNMQGTTNFEANKLAIEKITNEMNEMRKATDEGKISVGKHFGLGLLIFTIGIALIFIYYFYKLTILQW